MVRNGFFGSCVDARMIVDSQHRAYQDVFYKNFGWGVLENALKWQWMETSQVSDSWTLQRSYVLIIEVLLTYKDRW